MSGPLARPRRPKGRGQRPAVMTDVAKLAGVSHQTVSRVLHDSPHVRRGTRDRVLAAIRQLDYRPNPVAQALVTGRSRSLGVVSFDTTLYGPASTMLGIEEAAHDRGYAVSIASLRSLNRESVVGAVQRLRDQGVDGVVVIAPQRAAVDALLHLPPEVPVVAVEAGPDDSFPVVAVDQLAGAAAATRHLLDLGHRNIWHIAGPEGWLEAEQRIEGWRSTRCSASSQPSGPAMCQMFRWPRSSRCRVAAAAPASWSTATTGKESSGPASTATTGTSGGRCRSASTAARCGAITTTPSTPWSRSRCTAPTTDARFSERRLAMLTA